MTKSLEGVYPEEEPAVDPTDTNIASPERVDLGKVFNEALMRIERHEFNPKFSEKEKQMITAFKIGVHTEFYRLSETNEMSSERDAFPFRKALYKLSKLTFCLR